MRGSRRRSSGCRAFSAGTPLTGVGWRVAHKTPLQRADRAESSLQASSAQDPVLEGDWRVPPRSGRLAQEPPCRRRLVSSARSGSWPLRGDLENSNQCKAV